MKKKETIRDIYQAKLKEALKKATGCTVQHDGYGTISSIYIEKESIQNLLDNFEKKWKEYINEADEEKTSQRKAEYKEKLEQILKECDEWGVEYSCI